MKNLNILNLIFTNLRNKNILHLIFPNFTNQNILHLIIIWLLFQTRQIKDLTSDYYLIVISNFTNQNILHLIIIWLLFQTSQIKISYIWSWRRSSGSVPVLVAVVSVAVAILHCLQNGPWVNHIYCTPDIYIGTPLIRLFKSVKNGILPLVPSWHCRTCMSWGPPQRCTLECKLCHPG